MKKVVSPTDRPHETFEIDYYEDKKQQLIINLTNLLSITQEKSYPKLVKTYIDLAFSAGKIRGMDIILRKWSKTSEKIYGE